jgi:signal peptidase II
MQTMPGRTKRNVHLMIWPALITVVLDQMSKTAVLAVLRIHESVTVIPGLFNLVHVRNRGMAFGFLNRPDVNFGFYFLVAASIGAITLLVIWFIKVRNEDGMTVLALSLILGGAVGNLIDRLRFRQVVDFLDFYIGAYHWPAFNVADSAITVGTILLAITIFFRHRHV